MTVNIKTQEKTRKIIKYEDGHKIGAIYQRQTYLCNPVRSQAKSTEQYDKKAYKWKNPQL